MDDPRIQSLLRKREHMAARGHERQVQHITERLAVLGYVEPDTEE